MNGSNWLFEFDPSKVEKKPTRKGFGEALVELGKENPNVVALGADITGSVLTSFFKEAFPERFFSIGIAEQNMAGVAAGLSLAGKIPFMSTYGVFASCRCLDQIRTTIAYTPCNVKIGGAHGGISVGPDGATHQALEEFAIIRAIPNMTFFSPCDANQSFACTMLAGRLDGPVYLRFGREAVPNMTPKDLPVKAGEAQVFRRGKDLAIIGTGHLVYHCLEAAWHLEKQGVDAAVINNYSIKPMDEETIIKAAKETGAVVTAEEHQINGGLGGAVAEILSRNFPVWMESVGVRDSFGESGEPDELMTAFNLSTVDVIKACVEVLQKKQADYALIEMAKAAAAKAEK